MGNPASQLKRHERYLLHLERCRAAEINTGPCESFQTLELKSLITKAQAEIDRLKQMKDQSTAPQRKRDKQLELF